MNKTALRHILAAEGLFRFGAGGVKMTVTTWNEGVVEEEDPILGKEDEPHRTDYQKIDKTFGTVREAMDWLRGWSRRLGAKDQNWDLDEDALSQFADGKGPDDERVFWAFLEWKGKPFPKKQYQKALFYLKTGRAPVPVPRIEGKSLVIDAQDGTVLRVTPGNRAAWRSWTLDRGGRKNVVVNLGDTEEDAELSRQGLNPTRASEASGIIQVIDRYTDVRDQDLQKIWKALYEGDLRRLRF
ncbi:MAG: hypothetical protein CMJ67_10025 [Planctomycetaceae bacterium]|nr:hypothetical protein [Planctomycetaceae bacterium]